MGSFSSEFNSLSFALGFKSIRRLELEILTKIACGVGFSTAVEIGRERVNDSLMTVKRYPQKAKFSENTHVDRCCHLYLSDVSLDLFPLDSTSESRHRVPSFCITL